LGFQAVTAFDFLLRLTIRYSWCWFLIKRQKYGGQIRKVLQNFGNLLQHSHILKLGLAIKPFFSAFRDFR